MKGQRLFVRETRSEDLDALRELYEPESLDPGFEVERDGLIARLVGDLVAHLAWQVDRNRATITRVYVMKSLRGRHVGLGLIQQAVEIARQKKIAQILVSADCPAREFFLRTGFAESGDKLILEVS